ncbi:MAG: NDP-hexose 2,3-dehydratase family protein [Cyclobacteriaceae bacterium]
MDLYNPDWNKNLANFLFLKSAFCTSNKFIKTEEVIDWLKEQNDKVKVKVIRTSFSKLKDWSYEGVSGSIRHKTGKFFSIDGIRVDTNWGNVSNWEQPIINQPEVGYLGFITKEFDGVLYFLTQAKIEPGNVNYVQLSPTLQATRSNYTQVHSGSRPQYLEYFVKAKPEQILLDQLQSEQGGRFLKKRNRNIIIKIEDDIPVYDNFTWLTLAQIKKLMQKDNLVNMDTRTVVSGIPYGSFNDNVIDFFNFLAEETSGNQISKALFKSVLSQEGAYNSIEDIMSFMTHLKSIFDLDVRNKPLEGLTQWIFDDEGIYHFENKYFKVIPVDVEIGNREIVKWCQPMVEPAQEGLCAFVCKEINNVLHFIVQAKLEAGNFDIIEFAPTVQCLTGNYRQTKHGALPFLDYVLNARKEQIVYNSLQSEEGGRFYKEQNRNMIILSDDEIGTELPPNYIWMTLNQLHTFLKFNNYLNVQARSLIAAISYI